MVDQLNLATVIAGGEGEVVGKHHHVRVHLGAVGIGSG
jgi:hypothetical protein